MTAGKSSSPAGRRESNRGARRAKSAVQGGSQELVRRPVFNRADRIVLSDFEPLEDVVVPVIDHHEDALWTVMPYAETLPQSKEVTQRLAPLTDEIEEADVEFVSHGQTTGQPEIYQIKVWGNYRGEYRLRDYGGVVVSDEGFLEQLPYPLSEPDI